MAIRGFGKLIPRAARGVGGAIPDIASFFFALLAFKYLHS